MATKKTNSFDQWLAQHETPGEAKSFEFAGETWTLSKEISLGTVYSFQKDSEGSKVSVDVVEGLQGLLDPSSQVKTFLDKRFDNETTKLFIQVCFGVYSGQTLEEIFEDINKEAGESSDLPKDNS